MRRLAAVAGIGALGAAGAGILGIARMKGLAVILGPAGIGVYGQAWTFVLYAGTFAALGLGVGVTRFIAEAREREDEASIETTIALALFVPIAVGLVFLIGTISLAPFLGPALLDSQDVLLLALAASSIPLVALQNPLQHVIQGFEDVVGQNVAYLLYGAAFTVVSIVGAKVAGVSGAVAGLALGNVVLVLLYIARTRVLLGRVGVGFSIRSWRRLRLGPLGKTLLWIGAASLALTAVFSAADLFVRSTLLHSSGKASAGLWFALVQISIQFIGMLAGTVTYYTVPAIARAVARRDSEAVQSVLDNSLRLAILAVVPVILAINALRGTVVHLLFSSKFSTMERYMPAQMAGDILRTLGWVLGSALVPLGLTRQWVVIGVGSSLAYGVSGALLVGKEGLAGAVAAYIVLWALALGSTAWVLIRAQKWAPTLRTSLATLIAAGGLAGGTVADGGYRVLFVVLPVAVMTALLVRRSEGAEVVKSVRALVQRRSGAA
jgi:antigen flippase